jgi:beta-glucuronidase
MKMLRQQKNKFRDFMELKGPWYVKFGNKEEPRRIPACASWNEVFPDKRDYLGPAVYKTKFRVPAAFAGKKLLLRFDSVNYLAKVRLNGRLLGSHEGGHLPFEFELNPDRLKKLNILEVEVDGRLAPDRVPPGNIPPGPKDSFAHTQFPATSFDFFPYCGIHRKVYLRAVPKRGIKGITITTDIKGKTGQVKVLVERDFNGPAIARLSINKTSIKVPFKGDRAVAAMEVPRAKLWSPKSPHLYALKVEIISGKVPVDMYRTIFGIRTFKVKGNKLLLNNKPVLLKGMCRHEDFPGTGRGYNPKWADKDFKLLKWTGSNSFRTSHYPYAEEQLDLADKFGFMVIDETPAVGLFFKKDGLKRREQLCHQYVRDMISRDKNHASVVMWSLANEPHSSRGPAKPFFKKLANLARSLDKTRPVTLASYMGAGEKSFEFLDLVCVNRYFGWYSEMGQLGVALPKLSRDLDLIYRTFRKPVILSEFGADALPGRRAKNPEMFTEDYQKAMIEGYLKIAAKKPYIAGTHIWNMCDFKTGQGVHRPGGMNWKGVFTRDRKPKLAAYLLRRYWRGL